MGAGVLVACFLKAPEEFEAGNAERRDPDERDAGHAPGDRAQAVSTAHK